ncbi:hypothetical protein ACIGB6_00875 [Paeniglutamicibacter gangotriensis]|nr:hypothetical protein [Paeniglutamicibacter gangotriensis]
MDEKDRNEKDIDEAIGVTDSELNWAEAMWPTGRCVIDVEDESTDVPK